MKFMSASSTDLWKHYSDVMNEGLIYIHNRATGHSKSLKTQWKQFNAIGLNGVEWNSLYVIAARPGVGKTLIASSITRELQNLNPDQDFAVLHFQFEMLGRNMALREFSAANNMNIRYLQSAKDDGMPPLSSTDFDKLKAYASANKTRQEFIIDKALTVNEMQSALIQFYKKVGKPFVVTLDHTLLVKQSSSEKSKQETLNNLAILKLLNSSISRSVKFSKILTNLLKLLRSIPTSSNIKMCSLVFLLKYSKKCSRISGSLLKVIFRNIIADIFECSKVFFKISKIALVICTFSK